MNSTGLDHSALCNMTDVPSIDCWTIVGFLYSNTSTPFMTTIKYHVYNHVFFFLLSFSKWADDFCMIVLLKFCSVEDWLADVDLGVTARYLLLILVLMGKISDIAGIASVDEKNLLFS